MQALKTRPSAEGQSASMYGSDRTRRIQNELVQTGSRKTKNKFAMHQAGVQRVQFKGRCKAMQGEHCPESDTSLIKEHETKMPGCP
jgi:hypothetical protein